MTNQANYLEASPNHKLAYRYSPPSANYPTIVYLCGFRSDMQGEKVIYLEDLCTEEGLGYLAFDYSGHGESSGAFEEGTISQWLADSLSLIDKITQGPLILVGSSMGGWLAHLIALERHERIVGLLGIASAPDFTENLMWQKFSPDQKTEITTKGWTIIPTEFNDQGWVITRNLIEDGRKHLLLGKNIHLNIPIRYVHGLKDESVPVSYSQKLLELVTSPDISLTLVKSGDHRLSQPENKRLLWLLLQELIVNSLATSQRSS